MMGLDSTQCVSAADTVKAYLTAIDGSQNENTLDIRDAA